MSSRRDQFMYLDLDDDRFDDEYDFDRENDTPVEIEYASRRWRRLRRALNELNDGKHEHITFSIADRKDENRARSAVYSWEKRADIRAQNGKRVMLRKWVEQSPPPGWPSGREWRPRSMFTIFLVPDYPNEGRVGI